MARKSVKKAAARKAPKKRKATTSAKKRTPPKRAKPKLKKNKKKATKTSAAPRRKASAKKRTTVNKKKASARPSVKRTASKKKVAKPVRPRRATKRPAPSAAPSRPAPSPRKSRMSPASIAQFRELLLTKRAELIGDVRTLRDEALKTDSSGESSHMPIHMAELGSDHFEQELTLGLIESEHALLKEIDDALLRIENGTYGICAATSKTIGAARLKAKPWAKYCYEYVLAQEKGHQSGF